MGRLATQIAAAVADADNLPPNSQLPKVSFTDALLPRSWSGMSARKEKPTDPNVGRKMKVTYYDIKKNKNGSKSVVAHKSPAPSVHAESAKDKSEKKKDKHDSKGGEESKDKEDKKPAAPGGNNNNMKGDWTAEEDAKLKELKAQGKTWREIATELHRSQQQLKQRCKELGITSDDNKPAGDAGKGKQKQSNNDNKKANIPGKAGGDQAEEKNANQQNKKSKKEKKAEKKAEQQKNETAPATAKAGRQSNQDEGETRFTMREWLTLQEDDMFTFGELQLLTEIIGMDPNQTWLRIASRFFDITGRRVHPEDIREKFEQMNEMLA